MQIKYKEEYEIKFDTVDFTGKMSLFGLSSFMQIIAANHASVLNLNYYKNADNPGFYWIISRVKYVLEEYPKWEETIAIETYPVGYEKLYAVRKFDLYNSAGRQIGYIIGDYVLMDIERKRPVKIKGDAGRLSILDFPYEGEKLEKLKAPLEALREENRKAYYSEMDLNGHMNNSHYVKWVLDMLPREVLEKYEVGVLEINYNAAIEWGTEVKLQLAEEGEDAYIVSGNSTDGHKNYFIARIHINKC